MVFSLKATAKRAKLYRIFYSGKKKKFQVANKEKSCRLTSVHAHTPIRLNKFTRTGSARGGGNTICVEGIRQMGKVFRDTKKNQLNFNDAHFQSEHISVFRIVGVPSNFFWSLLAAMALGINKESSAACLRTDRGTRNGTMYEPVVVNNNHGEKSLLCKWTIFSSYLSPRNDAHMWTIAADPEHMYAVGDEQREQRLRTKYSLRLACKH